MKKSLFYNRQSIFHSFKPTKQPIFFFFHESLECLCALSMRQTANLSKHAKFSAAHTHTFLKKIAKAKLDQVHDKCVNTKYKISVNMQFNAKNKCENTNKRTNNSNNKKTLYKYTLQQHLLRFVTAVRFLFVYSSVLLLVMYFH